jgi:L-seryl-tRNA(Ser) seleniumtransferase
MQESIAAGVDLVTASGDKLLGGPQAGLILGKATLIAELKKHPLIRALRVDKATLAALQATLLAYREDKAVSEIPVWQMIALKPALLAQRAAQWQQAIQSDLNGLKAVLELIESRSTVGGGSLPGQSLPTTALAIQCNSAEHLAMLLRQGTPPIIGRVEHNRLLLDPRTVLPQQDTALIASCGAALRS